MWSAVWLSFVSLGEVVPSIAALSLALFSFYFIIKPNHCGKEIIQSRYL
jgi:hypothetical protein